MSYTSNQLSAKLRNISLVLLILAVGGCLLWVNSLKHTIQLRDDSIGALNQVNAELSKSNTSLRDSLDDEREAVKREVIRNQQLELQLKTKLGKFDNAVKDDKCANTDVPADVLDSLQ